MRRRNRYEDDVTHKHRCIWGSYHEEDEDIIATFGIGKGDGGGGHLLSLEQVVDDGMERSEYG